MSFFPESYQDLSKLCPKVQSNELLQWKNDTSVSTQYFTMLVTKTALPLLLITFSRP